MKREIETKFYNFDQNNSGGYFVKSEEHGVCEMVIVEAQNYKEAYARLESIGEHVDGFNNYCSCCGERWSNWGDDEDGTEHPMIYDERIEVAKKGMFRETAFVHYYDKTFKKFELLENDK